MNRDNLKHQVIRHAGLLVGGILGLLSGLHIFGLAIGSLLGYFADELLHGKRILKWGVRLAASGEPGTLDDEWIERSISIALAANVAAEAGTGLAERELTSGRIIGGLSIAGRAEGLARQLIERMYEIPVNFLDLSGLFRQRYNKERRVELMRLILSVCAGPEGQLTSSQDSTIAEIVRGLEIPDDVYTALRTEVIPVNYEAYETLGIRNDADLQEIKTVYRRLAAQFHPDTAAELEETQQKESQEAFVRIQNAYKAILKERGVENGG